MSPPNRPTFTNMASLLKHVEWPVMSEVGQALIRTLNDEDADIAEVCHIISRDPALTATLLRMANSAMFGLSGTVDSLERAVNVVGVSMVRARAVSICVVNSAKLPVGLDRMAFWHYCLLCAGYAQWLAIQCGVNNQEAWLCGMMLRLGEINLGQASPQDLPRVEATPIQPGERWVREREIIGFDEGVVTAELLMHWDFPPTLVNGLRHTAQPLLPIEFQRLPALLNLAGRLADSGAITLASLKDLPLMLLNLLQLDPEQLLKTAPDAHSLADVSMFIS
ncbi:MAG: HDOD domain-containing protein [Rhodoferax sp.]|nr:HDOD domain-containing protein [Rhodoferax sp.]